MLHLPLQLYFRFFASKGILDFQEYLNSSLRATVSSTSRSYYSFQPSPVPVRRAGCPPVQNVPPCRMFPGHLALGQNVPLDISLKCKLSPLSAECPIRRVYTNSKNWLFAVIFHKYVYKICGNPNYLNRLLGAGERM